MAHEWYDKALAIDPKQSELLHKKGLCYQLQFCAGQCLERALAMRAIEFYNEALLLDERSGVQSTY